MLRCFTCTFKEFISISTAGKELRLVSSDVTSYWCCIMQARRPRKQKVEWSRPCCLQLTEFPWGVSEAGYSFCQTESHPARSPCSTFHREQNCVPPHFRRKTAVWCSILETCERSVIKFRAAPPSAKNSTHYINFPMLTLCTVIKHKHMLPVILHHSEWFVFMQTPHTWGLDAPVWRFHSWSYTNPLIS